MSTEPTTIRQLTTAELEAGLEGIRQAPADGGALEMIVRRPAVGVREMLDQGDLDPAVGLVGDTWATRRSRRTADGSPNPEVQVNILSARVAAPGPPPPSRRPPARDQPVVLL